MTTDGGAQAGEAVPTGQRIEAFRAAYNDGVYLRAAVRPARVHGALGLLLAACDERTRERDALAAQVAALTAERGRLRQALTEHAVWRDWEGSDNYRCHICRDGAPKRDLILHALTCPLRVLSLAEWLNRRATTPPAGAQEG